MTPPTVDQIASTLLYEGYVLYPYRPSAAKNRYRHTFGALYPRESARAREGLDRGSLRAECLFEAEPRAELGCQLRFLQFEPADADTSWKGAVERRVAVQVPIATLRDAPHIEPFEFEGGCRGDVQIAVAELPGGAFRVQVCVTNLSVACEEAIPDRGQPGPGVMGSAHVVLTLVGGRFVSLLDPPPHLKADAAGCRNDGVWPVLVGEPILARAMLCSAIILYDYPRIAPQSPGDFFDATEIDEMLTLRVQTLTPTEKREVAQADDRARTLLERTSSLTPDQMLHLHAALVPRPEHPAVGFAAGDRVRLAPRSRADAFDSLLAGMAATVASIEHDVDGRAYLSVTIDDDPGRDLGLLGKPGHRFYYRPEEVEPWEDAGAP